MRIKNRIVTLCFLLAGVLMLAMGIVRGEHYTVLEKATKICLECIGIG